MSLDSLPNATRILAISPPEPSNSATGAVNPLVGFLLTALFASSCASTSPPATAPPHAFISYKAPEPGSKSLRLAVKDLIDMKGEVTSAGSEYLYKHSEPAKADAECLWIARRRQVDIVGKTNLSEFAIGVSGSNDYFGTPVNEEKARHRSQR
ncbi:MAG TPA: amidase family protein [Verrucomicrobiales bacterium]|nr:amidase family protein [Verrucomicrobiales bacterium]